MYSLRVRLLLTMAIVVLVAVGTIALLTSRSTTNEFERYIKEDMARNQRIVSDILSAYGEGQSRERLQELVKQLSQTSGQRLVIADGTGKVIADSEGKVVGQNLAWTLPVPPPNIALQFDQGIGASGAAFAPPPDVPVTPEIAGHIIADAPITSVVGIPITSQLPISVELRGGPAAGIAISGEGQDYLTWAPMFVPIARVHDAQPGAAPDDLIIARARGSRSEQGFLNSVNRSILIAVGAAGIVALLLTLLLSRRILKPVEALTAAARNMEKGDLTQRVDVRSKDEIGELARAFNAMADGLFRLEQLRRNMVTDVAHELRTPLSNIRGYLEALRDGVVRPTPAAIDSLHEEAMLLSRLVDDLQELELAEAGQLKLVRQEVALSDVIEKAATALRPLAAEHGLTIKTDAPADLPGIVADPERVGQVLRNLLNNALTHTPRGGEVGVSARSVGGEVEVSVRDTGPGIAPEHLPYIFERFYRADGSRARSTGGAGLGLSIVKQLVELHGGRVRAESAPGDGATFIFTLPNPGLRDED